MILFLLILVMVLPTTALAQSVNIRNGNAPGIAGVINSAPVGTEYGLVVRCIGCGGGAGGLTDAQLRASAVPVSGTFWQATQPVSGTFFQATQPVSGTFWQATQPVSGTFWQATQPVSIPGTLPGIGTPQDAPASTLGPATVIALLKALNLEITALQKGVTVSNLPASQTVSGAVAVNNFPATVQLANPSGFVLPPCNPVRRTQCQNQGHSLSVSGF